MKRMLFLIAAFLLISTGAGAQELTIDRMVGSPSLSGASINGLKFSPDGERITYLRTGEGAFGVQDLWEFVPETGERRLLVSATELVPDAGPLSEEERARRERQRITGSGIVEYYWSPDSDALLFPLDGDLFYLPLGGEVRQLTITELFETDARFSPRGNYVSFIRDNDLYVIDLDSGQETRLTRAERGTVAHGVAEFVAQEEMDRDTGYWWAPDESKLAYTRIDEEGVTLVNRYEMNAEGRVTVIPQRYPFAGEDNVLVDLGVIPVGGGETVWMDMGAEEDIYLARVHWHPDSSRLAIERQSRDQKRLDVLLADAASGETRVLFSETSSTWINLTHDFAWLSDGARILWSSERSGYRHLYLLDSEGEIIRQLTSGPWAVAEVKKMDEANNRIFFEGFRKTPIERHLYAVSMAEGGDITRITGREGWHSTVFPAGSADRYIDNFSSEGTPPRVSLHRADGERLAWIVENRLDETHAYAPYVESRPKIIYGTMEAEDGTNLHYSLRLPPGFSEEQDYPAVVSVYGGPGVQRVTRTWAVDFNEILARNGYVVLQLDNRGATNRGKAFEDVLYRAMGETEVADQARGAEFLDSLGYVDPDRIGVWGWSYGGYMTLMLLAKKPELFAAGMSVAPVTDWRLYDTHYTERYLGDPTDGDVYEDSSLFAHLDGMEDPLLLIHGMADDNVFFDHSAKLISELQQRNIVFDMMGYPGKRHGIRGAESRGHLWKTALQFFNQHLKGTAQRASAE